MHVYLRFGKKTNLKDYMAKMKVLMPLIYNKRNGLLLYSIHADFDRT